jgi:hypothetical protein
LTGGERVFSASPEPRWPVDAKSIPELEAKAVPTRATLNRTELVALHDRIGSALTDVIETDSKLMGISDIEAGLIWVELREVDADIVSAMFGEAPRYLTAN